MKEAFESIGRFLMRQQLLQRVEKEVDGRETPVCDIYLNEGTEYVVKWRASANAGALELSLKSTAGVVVPTYGRERGFEFIARESGVYRVWAVIRHTEGEQPTSRLALTVCCWRPVSRIPTY